MAFVGIIASLVSDFIMVQNDPDPDLLYVVPITIAPVVAYAVQQGLRDDLDPQCRQEPKTEQDLM